jgi:hypothetical protein
MVGTGKSGGVVKSRANSRIVIARICNSRDFYKNYSFSSFLFEKLLMKNYLKN